MPGSPSWQATAQRFSSKRPIADGSWKKLKGPADKAATKTSTAKEGELGDMWHMKGSLTGPLRHDDDQ